MIRYKVSPLFGKNGYICTCIMCIELEDDIFNMIELFARDKTLNAYLYQIGIVEVVCFQNVVRVWRTSVMKTLPLFGDFGQIPEPTGVRYVPATT